MTKTETGMDRRMGEAFSKIRKHQIKCVVTFWKALWQGAERVQAEGFHPGLDASWDALEIIVVSSLTSYLFFCLH